MYVLLALQVQRSLFPRQGLNQYPNILMKNQPSIDSHHCVNACYLQETVSGDHACYRDSNFLSPVTIKGRVIILLFLFLSWSFAQAQTIYYVTAAGAGAATGASWATAAAGTQLQTIINNAAAGSQVWVAAGTYKPNAYPTGSTGGTTNRDYAFLLKTGVAVYGGFVGTETSLSQRNVATNVTILSGDIGTANVATDNCYHVVVSIANTATAVLDGFTIQLGNANVNANGISIGGTTISQGIAGSIYCYNSSPTINNCTFINNSVLLNGGAIYATNSSRPAMAHCYFSTNAASNNGGAIDCESSSALTADSCTFYNNVASNNGGAIYSNSSSYMLDSCTFDTNKASNLGGAIANISGSNNTATYCVIKNNRASVQGGGIYNNQSSSPGITYCLIQSNTALAGGGVYNVSVGSATIAYCTFANNTATIATLNAPAGGGMYNDGSSNPNVKFCIFSANTAPNGGDGAGMYNDGGATPTDSACVFVANIASTGNGGGVVNTGGGNAKFFNCVFTSNSAVYGGGVYSNGSNGRCTNCTFYKNNASTDGGGSYCTGGGAKYVNDIFWGNTGSGTQGLSVASGTTPSVQNCDVQGGYTLSNSSNIINVDPLFSNAGNVAGADGIWRTADDGLELSCSSPAKDVGVTVASGAPSVDIIGTVRPQGAGVDLGAYEIPGTITISVQPVNTTICAGANTSFTVTAGGTSGLVYQWQVSTNSGSTWTNITNGGVYSNATTNTLTITAATAAMTGYQYQCVVSSSCASSVTSSAAVLTITAAVTFTTSPASVTICAGANTSFGVVATGTGTLTYQWQVSTNSGSTWTNISNAAPYSNATTNTLAITAATAAMTGYQYQCIVTGSCGNTASSAATLTVNTTPAITVQPAAASVCIGANTSFSVTATGTNLTYQWQVSTNSGSTWTNITNAAPYSGATTNTLTITAAPATLAGYIYHVIVSNTGCATATSSGATLTISASTAVSTQPTSKTICAGANTTFSVAGTGSGSLTYQWQVSTNSGSSWTNITNAAPYSTATTATLTITAATAAMTGYQYQCIISGTCGSATSSAATLTVNTAPAVTTQTSSVVICGNGNTTLNVTATGTNLTYQWQVNTGSGFSNITNTGVYSGATTSTLTITAATTTMNGYTYQCVVSNTGCTSVTSAVATLTVNTAPAVATQPTAPTICAGGNTTLNVTATGTNLTYQWQVNTGSGFSNISNTAPYSGATTAALTITGATASMNGYTYQCIVSNAGCAAATSNAVALTVNTAPAITTQPSSATACVGGSVNLGVTATGTNLTYQWQVYSGGAWTNITGATSATYALSNITASMNGSQYQVIVSNTGCTAVTSSVASITVYNAPLIKLQPTDAIGCVGATISFSVGANGSNLTYQWQVYSGGVWTNIPGATAKTYSIVGATSSLSGGQYRVLVTNTACANVVSNTVTLTVLPAPSFSFNLPAYPVPGIQQYLGTIQYTMTKSLGGYYKTTLYA